MYHTIIAAGVVGQDPEARYLNDGRMVCNFSVAIQDGFGDNKSTIWMRVSCFDKLAETVNTYVHKKSRVLVEGRLSHDKSTGGPKMFQRRDGTSGANFEIVAQAVRFLSSAGENGNGHAEPEPATQAATDDIPF